MLSNAQSKYIRSLTQQKYRKQNNVFLAEGDKIAREWLASASAIQLIIATEDWATLHKGAIERHPEAELCIVTPEELERVSALQASHKAMLVVRKSEQQAALPDSGWSIAVVQLQDPGNMGTIIRIADWFGLSAVVASADSVDFYNPKVVQAAMGGHLRVNLITAEPETFMEETKLPVYAATLNGESIYTMPAGEHGIILIGNESKGLPQHLSAMATHKITIPRRGGAESLNAAVSAGIIAAMLTGR